MNLIKFFYIILGLIFSSTLAVSRDQDKVQENVQENSDEDDEVSLISSDDDEGNIINYKL